VRGAENHLQHTQVGFLHSGWQGRILGLWKIATYDCMNEIWQVVVARSDRCQRSAHWQKFRQDEKIYDEDVARGEAIRIRILDSEPRNPICGGLRPASSAWSVARFWVAPESRPRRLGRKASANILYIKMTRILPRVHILTSCIPIASCDAVDTLARWNSCK
jgi:hypothetical protein